jgi:glycosyltransferase involved in cell wall biosynthesis
VNQPSSTTQSAGAGDRPVVAHDGLGDGAIGQPAPEVRLSVALVTRNRPESLARTLRSLRAQQVQPFELVVSDDSDAEHLERTRQVALEHGARHLIGPHRGLYANRNASAACCEGTHVRTMDDDHEFPSGHMAACLRAVQREPDTVWIIGECLPGEEAGAQPWVCPAQLHPRGHSSIPPPGSRIWAIADGAAIYPREIFDRGLRFSESFPFGAAYLEWGSRLHWLGYQIRHLDETFVIHHFDPAARSIDNHRYNAGSRLFAGMCHSFIYQPSPRNRALTVAELAATARRRRLVGVYAALDAIRAYRAQRRLSLQAREDRAPARL